MKIKPHPKFEGIFFAGYGDQYRLYTKNRDKGHIVYGERLVNEGEEEYREWNPYRSKLAATIMNKARNIYVDKHSTILYLGASSGTTVSHVSDLTENTIYAVEFAPRSIRELIQNCTTRNNVIPILADANFPELYAKFIFEEIDIIYVDIAQPNLTDIAILNCKKYLKDGGILLLAIKAKSIDVTRPIQDIFQEQLEKISTTGFEVLEKINISPYSKDHLMIIARYFRNQP
jgi:fibrillarin-like pre-rRNA processing protein